MTIRRGRVFGQMMAHAGNRTCRASTLTAEPSIAQVAPTPHAMSESWHDHVLSLRSNAEQNLCQGRPTWRCVPSVFIASRRHKFLAMGGDRNTCQDQLSLL